jgi:YggT family protein
MASLTPHSLCQRAAARPFTPIRSFTSARCLRAQRSTICCSSTPQQQQQQQLAPQQQHTTQQQASPASASSPQQLAGNSVALSIAALLALGGAAHAAGSPELYSIAEFEASAAHTLESILRPLFTVFTLLYIIRIPMTWYPSIDGTKLPWLLAYAPTEPILKVTRNVIPLVGGVDVTPIVWVGLISFFNEILLGPQGILMLIQRESGGF